MRRMHSESELGMSESPRHPPKTRMNMEFVVGVEVWQVLDSPGRRGDGPGSNKVRRRSCGTTHFKGMAGLFRQQRNPWTRTSWLQAGNATSICKVCTALRCARFPRFLWVALLTFVQVCIEPGLFDWCTTEPGFIPALDLATVVSPERAQWLGEQQGRKSSVRTCYAT